MSMRVLFGVLLLALPGSAWAEPKQPAKPSAKPTSNMLPLAGQAKRNPCAAYGQGFVAIEGTSTCVQIGGSISIGVGTTR